MRDYSCDSLGRSLCKQLKAAVAHDYAMTIALRSVHLAAAERHHESSAVLKPRGGSASQ